MRTKPSQMNMTRSSKNDIARISTQPWFSCVLLICILNSFVSNFTHLKAGLFSAVDSAFIIQIQPEIQVPGTPTMIVVAQSLLYISLGSTLLAALLAVLGMQWLMYYSTAGNKGTIEARGLEHQKKLDGLRKWKFDMVMQTFPLLLQLALLLFAVALTVYLWRIKQSLLFASHLLDLSHTLPSSYLRPLPPTLLSRPHSQL
jgi:hypothetical protein